MHWLCYEKSKTYPQHVKKQVHHGISTSQRSTAGREIKKTAQWMFTKVSNASHLLHQRKNGSRDFRVTMCYGSLEVTATDVTGIVTGIFATAMTVKAMAVTAMIVIASSLSFWGKSRTRVSFSHLHLSVFEASLARELHFHIFNFPFLRQVSHESFVFTSSTLSFWGKSRTRASISHLQLSVFEGSLARERRFHIFNILFLRQVSYESFIFTSST